MVKIYSTPYCPYCKFAKDFFKERNITFEEIDVSTDSDATQEMIEKSGQMGVPVIEIGKNIIVGFDKNKIIKALNNQQGGSK